MRWSHRFGLVLSLGRDEAQAELKALVNAAHDVFCASLHVCAYAGMTAKVMSIMARQMPSARERKDIVRLLVGCEWNIHPTHMEAQTWMTSPPETKM